jgi:CysZ protein
VHYFSAVLDGLIPGWLEWLRWLLWPLFALVLSAIAFFSFTLVANIIASPFYGPLAAKVLSNSGIAVLREESGGFTAALLSGLAAEGRRMAYFAVRALPLLLLSFIPVINLIAPLLWLVFGAWSLSLEYRAYPLEALGLRFDEQRKLAGSHRLDALSFGGAIMVGLGIPLLNILIAPAAVVGATLYAVDRKLGSHR